MSLPDINEPSPLCPGLPSDGKLGAKKFKGFRSVSGRMWKTILLQHLSPQYNILLHSQMNKPDDKRSNPTYQSTKSESWAQIHAKK